MKCIRASNLASMLSNFGPKAGAVIKNSFYLQIPIVSSFHLQLSLLLIVMADIVIIDIDMLSIIQDYVSSKRVFSEE